MSRGLALLLDRVAPARRSRRVDGIEGRLHFDDRMFDPLEPKAVQYYLQAGRSAVEALSRALESVGRDLASVERCLDLGSGHGRVMRHLVEEIPADRITACDIEAGAVRFCAAEFGVEPLVSKPRLGDVDFAAYDLVWSGSLLTHLTPADCDEACRVLGGVLAPDGVLAFSMHGEFSLENLGHFYGGAYAEEADAIRAEVAEAGISYRPYPARFASYEDAGYGMTWHDRSWFERHFAAHHGDAVRVVEILPRGWDGHHDVVVVHRPA